MKVIATAKGFFGGEVRKYDQETKQGEHFTIESRLDEQAKPADHKADIDAQFSSKWMKKA